MAPPSSPKALPAWVLTPPAFTADIPAISTAVRGTVQGGFGVLGNNVRGPFPTPGVAGTSLLGIGIDGFSRTGFGVRGMTKSDAISGAGVMGIGSPGHGIVGIARQTATTPVVPPPFVTGGPLFAGLFFGNFQVQGDFTVTGHKSSPSCRIRTARTGAFTASNRRKIGCRISAAASSRVAALRSPSKRPSPSW